jgi:capsular polysaccharide transport system permease protein
MDDGKPLLIEPGPVRIELASTRPSRPLWHRLKERVAVVDRLLVAIVIVPTLMSSLYFGLIASDVYISESRFVVRTPQRPANAGLVGVLLQGGGFTRAQDDTYLIHHFIESRDALSELGKSLDLRARYTGSGIDWVSRFPGPALEDSAESFHRYMRGQINVELESSSGISVLRVNAFDAKGAHDINHALLGLSEELVNRINDRVQQDMVRFATAEVQRAEDMARGAGDALATFRNRRRLFDPDRQSAITLAQVGKLQEELSAARIQIAQISTVSPLNPQLESLRAREVDLQRQIVRESTRISGADASLASRSAEYQRLLLQQASAEKQLLAALSSLETAYNEARRQKIYLDRVVEAHLPDASVQPRRLRSVATTLILSLVAWALLRLLLAAIREHRE